MKNFPAIVKCPIPSTYNTLRILIGSSSTSDVQLLIGIDTCVCLIALHDLNQKCMISITIVQTLTLTIVKVNKGQVVQIRDTNKNKNG